MKRTVPLSDNEKWEAVIGWDKGYDGLFFYGVRTTGVYCRPSCKSKAPARANVMFFDDTVSALQAGFRPCKRCRPDCAVFEPGAALVQKAKAILSDQYDKPVDFHQIGRQLGVSVSHLSRLFKQYAGLTPAHYLMGVRVERAMELLCGHDADVLEIACSSGFNSLSCYYRHFRKHTGCTPKDYRKKFHF